MKEFIAILSTYTPEPIEMDKTCEQCGIDSLDVAALVIDLEDHYNINIPDDEVEELTDIQSMYNLVLFKVDQCFKLHQMVYNNFTNEEYRITAVRGDCCLATRQVIINNHNKSEWHA